MQGIGDILLGYFSVLIYKMINQALEYVNTVILFNLIRCDAFFHNITITFLITANLTYAKNDAEIGRNM